MSHGIPWKDLSLALASYYHNPNGAGHRSIKLERMLRIYFMEKNANHLFYGARASEYRFGEKEDYCEYRRRNASEADRKAR